MDNAKGDYLCLQGESAKDFFHYRIGETVKITVTAILTKTAMESPSVEEEYPVAEFEVLEVADQPKDYSNMSSADMETEIHNVKNEDQPQERQSSAPNREDSGSIWTDMKRQEKIGRTPQRRPKPFRIG